jgi:hypothetical protein
MPGWKMKIEILCRALRLRQSLQALQEHHEGEAIRDKVPVPERAPYGTAGARRLDVDGRVLPPVPLKPADLVRRSGGNLVHGPVSLSGKRSAQQLSGITCYPSIVAVAMSA